LFRVALGARQITALYEVKRHVIRWWQHGPSSMSAAKCRGTP